MEAWRIVLALGLSVGIASAQNSGGAARSGGGGSIAEASIDRCVTTQQHDFARWLTDQFHAQFHESRLDPRTPHVAPGGLEPPFLTFYPLAGTLWRDLFTFNYVDIDPLPIALDWDCTLWTYNGHRGNDTDLRSFGEQVIGIPVYAALDGVVSATHDGEDDMNTEWDNQPANFVIIDHPGGWETWYWHLKRNSVLVAPGMLVRAGDPIGQAASSGVSAGPHLHFELRRDNEVVEPFAGECQPGESLWVDQPPIDRSAYLHDFGITYADINQAGPWPYEWPRSGQIALDDPWTRIWWYGTALPPLSTWQVEFVRPDGAVSWTGPTQLFANVEYWRWYNWWWSYDISEMHTITGTWHVRLFINGELAIEAPIEVVEDRDPNFNRPPVPIGVHLEPAVPVVEGVTRCVVDTPLDLDDLDYDIVRYEYRWLADGAVIRHVTTAAQSDVLAHHLLEGGETLECRVTPRDEHEAGLTASVEAVVRCSRFGDADCDGDIGLTDFVRLFDCIRNGGEVVPACVPADSNSDGAIDLADFALLQAEMGPECGVRVTADPVSAQVCLGDALAFTVTADGSEVQYTWLFQGIPVQGVDAPTLPIDPVTPENLGAYRVVTTSDCGLDYSHSASLSAVPAPVVLQQPENARPCLEGTATFEVAIADQSHQLQWLFDGDVIDGASASTLVVEPATPDVVGAYQCRVTNSCGDSVLSDAAMLEIRPIPSVTTQPAGGSFCVGDSLFLIVAADEADAYQWFKDGEPIPGATTAFFGIGELVETDSGAYHADAINPCGVVSSEIAEIAVEACPSNP